jgi:hypothetical protein
VSGIAFILAAVAGAYFLFLVPRSPAYAVQKFMEADQAGNFTEQNRYVSTRWDSHLLLSAFQAIRQQSGASPFQKSRIVNTYQRNDIAVVSVELTLPNPPPVPANPAPAIPANNKVVVSFQLVREGNDWLIDPAQTMAGLAGVLVGMGINQSPIGTLFPLPGGLGGTVAPPIATPPTSAPPTNSNGNGTF